MKVIDLLNKIANGEKVPDAIKWGCHDFEWFVYEYKAKGELGEPTLLDYLSQCPQMLNDKIITFNKVEEKKIPEKLDIKQEQNIKHNWKWVVYGEEHKYNISTPQKIIANKINEIIDYLKSKEE